MKISFLYVYILLFSTLAFVSYTQEITVNLAQLTNTLQQLSSYLPITTSPADKQAENALKFLQDILAELEKAALQAFTTWLFKDRASAISQNITQINSIYLSLSVQFQTTIKHFFTDFNSQLALLLFKGFKSLKINQESVTESNLWAVSEYNRSPWYTFIELLAIYRTIQSQYVEYLPDKNLTVPTLEDPVLHSIISTFHTWIETSFLYYLQYIGDMIFKELYASQFPNVPQKPLAQAYINHLRRRTSETIHGFITSNIQTLLNVVSSIKPYIKLNTKVFDFELKWLEWLTDMNIIFNDLLLNSSYKKYLDWPTQFSILPSLQLGILFSGNFKDMQQQAVRRFEKISLLIDPANIAQSDIFDNLAGRSIYEKFVENQFERYSMINNFFNHPIKADARVYHLLFLNKSQNTPVQFVNTVTQLNENLFKALNNYVKSIFDYMSLALPDVLQMIEKQT